MESWKRIKNELKTSGSHDAGAKVMRDKSRLSSKLGINKLIPRVAPIFTKVLLISKL